MRKTFTILFVCLLAGLCVMAQAKKPAAKKRLVSAVGVKTGLNFSHLILDDLTDQPVETLNPKWRTGFVLGGFITIPVYKHFSIQPEFGYSSMGGDYWVSPSSTSGLEHVRARYNYFSVPVLVKYGFCKHFAVVAGPQFDVLISGKESRGSGTYKVSDDLKDHDVLATGGLEFWAGKCVVFQVRYMRGFNDVDVRPNTVRYYNEGVQATVGVKF
jgi:hypothetical protein